MYIIEEYNPPKYFRRKVFQGAGTAFTGRVFHDCGWAGTKRGYAPIKQEIAERRAADNASMGIGYGFIS